MKTLYTLALLTLLTTASAEVFISGPRSLTLAAGTSETVQYTLSNTSDAPVRATIFTNDYVQAPNGNLTHVPGKSLSQSLERLMTFPAGGVVVPAKGSVVIPAKINVPTGASGGYWGVVGVDAETAPVKAAGNSVGIHLRYAMVTALEVKDTIKHAVSIANVAQEGGNLLVTFKNAGNAYERLELRMTYQNAAGKAVDDVRPYVILPGTADLTVPIPAGLTPGAYAVFLSAQYAGDAVAEAASTLTVAGR
ncbi:hypothetical protein ACI3L1_18160 [Deinococcus sp. SM5_A1]|uniref:hypothetical protein n=1 Tax=Deinococcus sp. SM5_A1 TaxID=3379094 RepID=UPI00385BACD5